MQTDALPAVPSTALFGKIPPFRARYKNRTPDPGECVVISLDWEEQRLSMSNGACRYFPTFDEVDFILPNVVITDGGTRAPETH
jgi:hypothetical protein